MPAPALKLAIYRAFELISIQTYTDYHQTLFYFKFAESSELEHDQQSTTDIENLPVSFQQQSMLNASKKHSLNPCPCTQAIICRYLLSAY